ncbi:MFS transporter [Microbacterium sp. ASV49]|uniref:MFS transporter n=1 Tax=Microbacterium candidum TaxID=3041922 RepID=A0ABT7MWJ8_9MICO|nr:MFS transporter [Microbacterium sp. ASV49]MDL9978808.1 MFS transporter [Microbacterium sp. ASV49]
MTSTIRDTTIVRRRWWGLTLIAAAQFAVIMDTSIIGVALPDIQLALGFTPESLSWVFNAYVVAFGGLLLLGGRLADVFGARRMFAIGWAVLLVGSVVAGAAGDVPIEIAGRAIQGAGAALIAPAALTLLMTMFGGTSELPRAFAVYGAAAPIGGSVGVFLGGVLTQWAGWPWVFYATVPLAALVLALTPALLPPAAGRRARVDGWGAVTSTAGLGLLVFAIVRAPEAGWLTAATLVPFVAGVLLLIAFVAIERRVREPLLRLSLLRRPLLGGANVAQLLLGATWVSMWFFLNLHLQNVLHATPFLAGAALLPMTALIVVGMTTVSPRLAARFGTRAMVTWGFVLLAVGLVWLAFARPDGSYVVDVLPATLVAASGMALAFVPSLSTAISAAPQQEAGVASGLVNTSYQIGSALGLAVLTALVASVTPGAGAAPYTGGFLGAAIVAALGILAGWGLLRAPASRLSAGPAARSRD